MLRYLLAIACLLGFVYWFIHLPVATTPGASAPLAPIQSPTSTPPWQFKGFTLTPLASYQVTARILGTREYYLDDNAKLSPLDLVLGWEAISDPAYYTKIKISQQDRFYTYEYGREFPKDIGGQIGRSSANTHIIPANSKIHDRLMALRTNQTVTLAGYLIEATRPDGWRWRSSLSRDDTGQGACEVFWVESVEVLQPVSSLSSPKAAR